MNSRNRKIIIGVLALFLVLSVGYALLTETLKIDGTASAKGDFNIIFESIGTIDKRGYTDATGNNGSNIAVINELKNKKQLDIEVNKLDYPGAYVEIPVVISNEGSIDAILESIVINSKNGVIEESNNIVTFDDIELRYEMQKKENENNETSKIIKSKEKRDMLIKITWLDKENQSTNEMEAGFSISLNYKQSTTPIEEGGSGSGSGSEDTSWKYKVDESGELTAYNYAYGTDVKVPAEVDGVPVKTITQKSFLPASNVSMYYYSPEEKTYAIIDEEESNYSVVKDKFISLFCGEDSSCMETLYACKDKDTCYSVAKEEQGTVTKESIPEDAELEQEVCINPDPDVSLEESIIEKNINALDLSEATNLTTIGDNAFDYSNLTSVNFGENSNVETIGNYAFSNNQITGTLTLPSSVTTVGESAFYGNQITGLSFEESSSLTMNDKLSNKVVLLNNTENSVEKVNTASENGIIKLKSIGNSAFSSNQISSLTIPSSVTTIGTNAFSNNQIGNLTIPSSVTTIGTNAFSNNQIGNLTIPSNVTTIGTNAFYNNPIGTLVIEKCISGMFENETFGRQIKNLTIKSGEIGKGAFDQQIKFYEKLEKLVLGEGVTEVGDSAFSGNQISSLIIPSSLATIGQSAFSGNQISTLDLSKATNLTTLGLQAFAYNQISTLDLSGATNLTTISMEAFSENQISALDLSGATKLTTIESSAFYRNQINNLTIPSSVTTLSGFSYNQISSLTIPSSVTTIGNQAFDGNQISTLDLSRATNLTTIGSNAFYGNQISSLTIPSSVTTIKDVAFSNNQISTLDLSGATSLITIGDSAFNGNQITGAITIPSSVTSIGQFAFSYGSNNISSILIKRTQEDFLANVTVATPWYSGSPTITYEP